MLTNNLYSRSIGSALGDGVVFSWEAPPLRKLAVFNLGSDVAKVVVVAFHTFIVVATAAATAAGVFSVRWWARRWWQRKKKEVEKEKGKRIERHFIQGE